MITIRNYVDQDAQEVGILIADTFTKFNLSDLPLPDQTALLGPFAYARSEDALHRQAIAEVINAPIVLVAEDKGVIIGILRGGYGDRLNSLFVHEDYHRRGIGRRLVAEFEELMVGRGVKVVRLAATPYGVPFYLSVGYKRSSGLRSMHIFEGAGGVYQPMRKALSPQAVRQNDEGTTS